MAAVRLCKQGCGRPAAPGLTKGGRPYDTCCRLCVNSGRHDADCCRRSSAVGDYLFGHVSEVRGLGSVGQRHDFQCTTFSKPSFCAKCGSFLWGIREQGEECRFCSEIRCFACGKLGGHCPRDIPKFSPPLRISDAESLEFSTLHEAFEYCKPNESGLITERTKFAKVAMKLALDGGDVEVVWSHLDQDGNGAVSFPEFVEWAESWGVPLPTGVGGGDMGVAFPRTWSGPRDDPTWNRRQTITDSTLLAELQGLLDITYKDIKTRDRKCLSPSGRPDVPRRFELVSAQRSENYHDWRGYYLKRHLIERSVKADSSFMKFKPLTSNADALCGSRHRLRGYVNEWFLFHGTTAEAAESICKGDFTMKLAGSATGTMYGSGTYMAESITKADEYAREDSRGTCAVLVCRVIGGRVLYNEDKHPDGDSLQKLALSAGYHTVIGDREKVRGTFKEYVVFDADQIFVEYVLLYRRKYS